MSGNITGSLSPAPAQTSAPAPSTPSPAPSNQNVPPPGAVNSTPKSERTGQKPSPESSSKTAQDSSSLESQGSHTTPPGKDSGATTATPELLEGKINGRTVKLPKEEWIRRAQLAEAAQEKFEAAAQKEKRADRIISQAKQNPLQALMDPELGLTKEQIIEHVEKWYAKEVIEPEGMSAEAKRIRELEAWKADQEAKILASEKRTQAEQEQREVDGWRESLQKQIIDAIESKRLKKSPFAIAMAAQEMRIANLKGYEAPMDLIVDRVAKKTRDIVRGELEGLDYEGMVDLIGQQGIDTIRKAALQELRKRRQNGQFAPAEHQNIERKKPDEPVRPGDVSNYLRNMRFSKGH